MPSLDNSMYLVSHEGPNQRGGVQLAMGSIGLAHLGIPGPPPPVSPTVQYKRKGSGFISFIMPESH